MDRTRIKWLFSNTRGVLKQCSDANGITTLNFQCARLLIAQNAGEGFLFKIKGALKLYDPVVGLSYIQNKTRLT